MANFFRHLKNKCICFYNFYYQNVVKYVLKFTEMDQEFENTSSASNENEEKIDDAEEMIDFDFEIEDQNKKLEDRIQSLKGSMDDLRYELTKEREVWRQEVEDAEKLRRMVECSNTDDSLSQTSSTEPTLNDMSLLNYDQKLAVYQEALSKAQTEKRMQVRRHLAANAYKQRLMEVENMCNLELLKVKQSIQYLQPLQAMASEWSHRPVPIENVTTQDEEISGMPRRALEMKKSTPLTVENLGHKINDQIKDVANMPSPLQSNFSTMSSLFQEDDQDLMATRLQSMAWYNNDVNHFGYNPLM